MNGRIALRDIIKAIVILKPGATMAVIQRMIWTKTPSATIGTALHCIVEQGLFTTRIQVQCLLSNEEAAGLIHGYARDA